ncbi:hypothetical protein [Streptomyces argyrophylli]|uniref:Uncharacterized protein n=1 Tax=Streptomyces argyrophylli TaxID=2726118 RepID=A0A6M4PM13_9ACTN|nr:hypothetical protein [Streptomyces argyrophyllae]QJS12168.1 hypothetical protein HKX69_23990 [Streptomyces argyrophyllae]
MSDRELWASTGLLATFLAFVVSVFVGPPAWFVGILFAALAVSVLIIWTEQRKRGHR